MDAPTNHMFAPLAILLAPGRSFAKQALVPADFAPGTYRVVDHAFGAASRIDLAAQFEVTP